MQHLKNYRCVCDANEQIRKVSFSDTHDTQYTMLYSTSIKITNNNSNSRSSSSKKEEKKIAKLIIPVRRRNAFDCYFANAHFILSKAYTNTNTADAQNIFAHRTLTNLFVNLQSNWNFKFTYHLLTMGMVSMHNCIQ